MFEALKESIPDFIPIYGEYLDFKRGVEAFNQGDYWQSTGHCSMAMLSIIGFDKVKDFIKLGKGIKRAYKLAKLVNKVTSLPGGSLLAKGFTKIISNANKLDTHIFRISPGHMPAMESLVKQAGGKENLVYLVYKEVAQAGYTNSLAPGQVIKDIYVTVLGQKIKTSITRVGNEFIQIPDFWIP